MPNIILHNRAEKKFSRFPKHDQEKVAKAFAQMKITPFESLNTEKFQTGQGRFYRTRIGNIRILFEFDSKTDTVYIIAVDYRGNIY